MEKSKKVYINLLFWLISSEAYETLLRISTFKKALHYTNIAYGQSARDND